MNDIGVKILYMSDKEETLGENIFENIEQKFEITKIRTFKNLKVNFNNFKIIFLDIENQEFFRNILLYIKENKHDQKVLTSIRESDSFLIVESIAHKISEFIFSPIQKEDLRLTLERFDRELNLMTKVYKIRSLESRELKKNINNFYTNDFKSMERHFHRFESVLRNILNADKYKEHKEDLIFYFLEFIIQDRMDRTEYVNNFSLDMLYKSNNDRIEDTMIRPVIEEVIIEFKEIYGKEGWSENFIDRIRLFFEMEIRLMGLNLKFSIQKMLKDKERDLHSNSLHILMSSSSDKLNNYASVIDSKSYAVNRLLKLDDDAPEAKRKKVIDAIKSKGMPLDDFKYFLKKQSKIFTSFKSEISNKSSVEDLIFLVDFVYMNGMKVKYNHIKTSLKISLTKEEVESIMINTNENMILTGMYSIIENAIEANSSNIEMEICKVKEHINIIIKNDGDKITKEIEKNLFYKFFTTKSQFGLGLYIVREWLQSIDYKLGYNSKRKAFVIEIPIIPN